MSCVLCVYQASFSNEFTQSLMRKTEVCRRSFSFCFSSPTLSEGTEEGRETSLEIYPQRRVIRLLLEDFPVQKVLQQQVGK